MNRVRIKRVATALAIASLSALMVGCGSKGGGTTPIIGTPTGTTPGGIVGAGCIPLNQPISFSAQGIYFSGSNIVMGLIPGSAQPIGQVIVGAGATQGGPYTRNAVDGTISMNILPTGTTGLAYPSGYPNSIYPGQIPGTLQNQGYPYGFNTQPQTATATGFLQIAPATQQDIMYQTGSLLGYGSGYGTGYGTGYGYPYGGIPQPQIPAQQLCVSGLALNSLSYNGILYNGQVFLYLNNTQHGYYFPL